MFHNIEILYIFTFIDNVEDFKTLENSITFKQKLTIFG